MILSRLDPNCRDLLHKDKAIYNADEVIRKDWTLSVLLLARVGKDSPEINIKVGVLLPINAFF